MCCLITQWLVLWLKHVWVLMWDVTLCATVLTAAMSKTVVSLKKKVLCMACSWILCLLTSLSTERQSHLQTLSLFAFDECSKVNCYSCDSSQGHNGQMFECDFEDAMCGWTDQSIDAPVYKWDRFQQGDALPDSGPSSDYTTGTATGTVE